MTTNDPATRAEGDRLAVGAFTAMSSFDPLSARKVLEDAEADELREAVVTIAGVMCGLVIGSAQLHGIPIGFALDHAVRCFAALTQEAHRG